MRRTTVDLYVLTWKDLQDIVLTKEKISQNRYSIALFNTKKIKLCIYVYIRKDI